ncbi:hypothetical protein GW931_00810 [archaeon]|nr:hypothetical protein [archaeon]PJC45458.1 MAG: hypothetical protein CO037_01385 [Candidatus Pacearchaeota archaeon CG_4_9_14_0_2_um_filter_30_8]
MSKWLKIVLGLILLVVPLALIMPGMPLSEWGVATLELIKGGITIVVILIGIILIVMGIDELKN